ncbi:hypothetical protein VNO77_43635 [Canavalia gladiata]|uniref:Plastid movement impaired 2 n=1 Tax=Canavalia gladiata TaxID=3824 RepID=A0AAN9JUK7_CANGL
MGNAMGGGKKAKVMKIDGETFKLKTPVRANDVVKNYPGHVLLDSHAVKHFGLRAKPLEPHHELKPKKIYFLVELPKVQPEPLPRRVRSSGIRGMNAKDRLDFLMLSKRSVSDLTMVKQQGPGPDHGGPTRVKMRLPKAQLDRLMEESNDGSEMAEKIISLYMGNNAAMDGGGTVEAPGRELHDHKPQRKRVSFSPVEQGEIREEAAPQQSLVYSSPSR